MVFPLQTFSLLFKLLSASFWDVAKAIGPPTPTHWQLEHSSPQGLSLEVSGDELPTHLAHTAQGGVAPNHAILPFANCSPLRGYFSPLARPTARLSSL